MSWHSGVKDIHIDTCLFIASQLTDSALNISVIEYSPLLGGFSIVLSDGRAAFITASTLKFEPLVSIMES